MLDFFVIFSKGGIILWYFQSTKDAFVASVNTLVKTVILQERTSLASFESFNWRLKHRLDNEYQLVFVVGFQKILQLSYVDKLLDDVHREFRDKYINQLITRNFHNGFAFDACFTELLSSAEAWARSQEQKPRAMRSFDQSQKSQKTLASMIEKRAGSTGNDRDTKGKIQQSGESKSKDDTKMSTNAKDSNKKQATSAENSSPKAESGSSGNGSPVTPDSIAANRRKMAAKAKKKGPKSPSSSSSSANAGVGGTKKTKAARVWALSGSARDAELLDFSEPPPEAANGLGDNHTGSSVDQSMVGSMVGNIQDLDVDETDSDESDVDEEVDSSPQQNGVAGKKSTGGMLSMFRGLVGSKTLTQESIAPALTKLKDHLVGKNVAADIAAKLCDSVAAKLDGRVLGTFEGVSGAVRSTLVESLTHVLSPRRRIDILRDVLKCRQSGRPYTMAMCGVNGVGKSTNLAKICFWLIENGFSVLIAACDTFRAGAVEQLRTHASHLNALHPAAKHKGKVMVQLYEKGYGKDPAGVAADAISAARESRTDVVLIDTAGRMQDNEPLMRALAKLVKVNDPDLVLFVGEALVGNEAVDQLVKFDRALADYSTAEQPHTIDGIVLTKFDTIDDKVGAAISMTYVTGQPIVFVGCGQTYRDLRKLNADAVVSALMK